MPKPKKTQTKDPHAAREAERYDNPIPSREFILSTLSDAGEPLTHGRIAERLQIEEEASLEALRHRLRAMQRDGQVIRNRRGAYGVVDRMNLVRCRVQGHRDGYGFAVPVEGGEDIYLSARRMREVLDGDTVLVALSGTDHRGRAEGKVVEILEHEVTSLVGRYQEESGIGFVIPDNPRITQQFLVPPADKHGARPGQIVGARIREYPSVRFGGKAEIVEVLGDHLDPGLEIEVAIRSHGIPWEWPEAALDEAAGFAPEPLEADKKHRLDLRDLPFVTIDGEDARDFDDAVYCERTGSGWLLWVAIADVSHYVRPGTALDQEAARRGNSVYFPGRVVPMFPEVLSNGLCSLNPEVDRLALVVRLELDERGELGDFHFAEAVIRSHARLTYTQVGAALAGERVSEVRDRLQDLQRLHALYRLLRRRREQREAIDFETTETRIIFDEQRKIEAIVPVVRNDAHKLIEECMLCANVAAARFFEEHDIPMLYRVHEGPTPEKLENLRAFLGELGLDLRGGDDPTPAHYSRLLQDVSGREDAAVIQTMLLRSLRQAVYRVDNAGHFGLNYEAYTHFTSPIRRYPDLLVHRGIRSVIRSRRRRGHVERVRGAGTLPRAESFPYDEGSLVALGEHCSVTERRADDATRDVEAWLKCEYLEDRVGEVFPGVVSAVTGFGLFVQLSDLYVEGLVHVTALPGDYYHFDHAQQRLVGEHSRAVFGLGDPVRVQVVRVDLDERKIDLELVDAGRPRKAGRGEGREGRARKKRPDAPGGARPKDRRSDDAGKGSRKDRGRRGGKRKKR